MPDNFLQLNSEKTETFLIVPDNMMSIVKLCIRSLSNHVQHKLHDIGVIFDQALSFDILIFILYNAFDIFSML